MTTVDYKFSIYRLLNQNAKNWWYHKDLRKSGDNQEARKRERRSIKDAVRTIRNACLFTVHDQGFSLNCQEGKTKSTLSGHSAGEVYSISLARCRPEVPRIDRRGVGFRHRSALAIAGPMFGTDQVDPPNEDGTYGGFSYAPMRVFLALNEMAGAKVHWGKYESAREQGYSEAQPTADKLGFTGQLSLL